MADPALGHVTMLVGTWQNDDTTESWRAPRDGVMRGGNVTVVEGEIVHEEYLFIEHRDGAIVYNAFPKGQDHNAFTLTSSNAGELIFEDPEHDFPQKIIYRVMGDELLARVEGSGKSSEWRFVRSCPKKSLHE